jgi:hypothetical protein
LWSFFSYGNIYETIVVEIRTDSISGAFKCMLEKDILRNISLDSIAFIIMMRASRDEREGKH